MEAAAATKMWRSLSHGMRYINFISDGDSSSFLAVKALNDNDGPYGRDLQVKEECVNHVAKRLGTGLRNIKQTAFQAVQGGAKRRKTLGGRNRLTDNVIDRLQYYFHVAVR